MPISKPFLLLVTLLSLVLSPLTTQAAIQFSVTIDTSSLVGAPSPPAPFYVEFQLNDGSGMSDGNNTATISNFAFGSGSAGGAPSLVGGASGDLSTGVAITDSSFFNEFMQDFTPGSILSFDVLLTTNVDGGGTPDQFSFALLYTDSQLGPIEIPTTNPYGINVLFSADIDSSSPTVRSWPSDGEQGPNLVVPEPSIVQQPGTVPEPATVVILGSLLAIGGVVTRRKTAR